MLLRSQFLRRFSTIPNLTMFDEATGISPELISAANMLDFMIDNHKVQGPIFGFWLDKQYCVSVSSEYWKPLFPMWDRPPIAMGAFLPLLGEKGIFASNTAQDAQGRRDRYMKPSLSARAIQSHHFPQMQSAIRDQIFPAIERSIEESDSVQLFEMTNNLAMQFVSKGALGELTQDQITMIRENLSSTMKEMELRLNGNPPNPDRNEEFDRAVAQIRNLSEEKLNLQLQNPSNHKGTLIDYLAQEGDKDLARDEFTTFLIAGIDTSAAATFWVLNQLGRRPDIQEKLQQEIDQHVEGDVVNYLDMAKMKYLRKVIQETLRRYTVAGWTLRFDEESDIEFPGGQIVTKGTPIFIPIGMPMLDEKYYPDPYHFDPDRFDDPNNKTGAKFSPFGYSKQRICPGRSFAYAEIMSVVASIFKNYNLKVSVPEPDYLIGLVRRPAYDIPGVFTRR